VIAAFEEVGLAAWPPRDRIPFDGWVLCESGGFTRRTNSVLPLAAGRLPLGDKLAHCEAFYAERGSRTVFKMTSASEPPALDEVLAVRGYRHSDPTSVQTVELGPGGFSTDTAVRIRPGFRLAWLRDCASIWGLGSNDTDGLRDILMRISADPEPCAFAWIEEPGATVAVGLGVIRGRHVFLGEIAARPDARRRGLGRRIVETLLAWGASNGASLGMLQVVCSNGPAVGLYRKLGFAEQYRYWYRESV
jgi:ribosomal protein S18 acetylase RimI-like enzyme